MRISDQVVMKLQALIEERHMKKGDRLPAERQLATSLGVSRPSLREAIQQLNSQGVLISRRGDGTYIQQLPEQWPQQLIVNPISNLIEEDPLYLLRVPILMSLLVQKSAVSFSCSMKFYSHLVLCLQAWRHFF